MLRFLHAADLHLDSPLDGLDAYEGAPVEMIRGATRRALENLVRLAIRERVAFVVLAGDLYDGDWRDYNTGLFFIEQMRELERAEIPVVMISGNHDAQSRITARLTLPKNVQALPNDRPGTVSFDQHRVSLHGQGYAQQAETRNLAASYPKPMAGHFNIGVLHTSLDGREGHASYAPCTLGELCVRGYDYWALGHIHQRESVNGSNHPRVEFPGNIQGRHIRESGAKGCLIVSVDDRGRAEPVFTPLDVFRFESLTVDASAAEDEESAIREVDAAVSEVLERNDGLPVGLRLTLRLSASVHGPIAGRMQEFRIDLSQRLGTRVWLEKLRLRTMNAAPSGESAPLGEDAWSALQAALDDLQGRPAGEGFPGGEIEKLRRFLPAPCQDVFETERDEIFQRASALLRGRTAEVAP